MPRDVIGSPSCASVPECKRAKPTPWCGYPIRLTCPICAAVHRVTMLLLPDLYHACAKMAHAVKLERFGYDVVIQHKRA